ncbi:MAG: Arc family DNA-binding protein [Defluviitaleaceae bacterium]|nr:Arc family DNA-binding protein [Defluviitaleaceae bacterium]
MAEKSDKKQVPLRLSSNLWNEINKWADDEFRSINGQIEYILSEAVKRRKSMEITTISEEGKIL